MRVFWAFALIAAGLAACIPSAPEPEALACPTPRPQAPVSVATPSAIAGADGAQCLTEDSWKPRDTQTVPCGQNELTVFRLPTDPRHSVTAIHFNDQSQKAAFPSIFHTGSFQSLCKQARFLLVSDDVHFLAGPSFVMHANGTVAKQMDLGDMPHVTTSDDHRIFWIETHELFHTEETRLRVFDIDGNLLHDKRYRELGKTEQISHGGQVYNIKIKSPARPG